MAIPLYNQSDLAGLITAKGLCTTPPLLRFLRLGGFFAITLIFMPTDSGRDSSLEFFL